MESRNLKTAGSYLEPEDIEDAELREELVSCFDSPGERDRQYPLLNRQQAEIARQQLPDRGVIPLHFRPETLSGVQRVWETLKPYAVPIQNAIVDVVAHEIEDRRLEAELDKAPFAEYGSVAGGQEATHAMRVGANNTGDE